MFRSWWDHQTTMYRTGYPDAFPSQMAHGDETGSPFLTADTLATTLPSKVGPFSSAKTVISHRKYRNREILVTPRHIATPPRRFCLLRFAHRISAPSEPRIRGAFAPRSPPARHREATDGSQQKPTALSSRHPAPEITSYRSIRPFAAAHVAVKTSRRHRPTGFPATLCRAAHGPTYGAFTPPGRTAMTVRAKLPG